MSTDALLAGLLRGQHGLARDEQVIACGMTPEMIRSRLSSGVLDRPHQGVLRAGGSPRTWRQELLAVCLSLGDDAVVSHLAAARLWGLRGPFAGHVEASVPRAKAPRRAGAEIHRTADLRDDDVVWRDGIPVTRPERTLVDLGAVCRWPVVDRAIDAALSSGLATIEGLWKALLRVSRQGRSGSGVLRACLEWRFGVPDSVLEGLFLEVVRDFDLPEPHVQHHVHVNGRDRYLDAAYPERMLAIELDGAATHATPEALEHDLRRQNDIIEAGFTLLRFGWNDLTRHRGDVARQVSRVYTSLPLRDLESHRVATAQNMTPDPAAAGRGRDLESHLGP